VVDIVTSQLCHWMAPLLNAWSPGLLETVLVGDFTVGNVIMLFTQTV
jgi:hypothetical protein